MALSRYVISAKSFHIRHSAEHLRRSVTSFPLRSEHHADQTRSVTSPKTKRNRCSPSQAPSRGRRRRLGQVRGVTGVASSYFLSSKMAAGVASELASRALLLRVLSELRPQDLSRIQFLLTDNLGACSNMSRSELASELEIHGLVTPSDLSFLVSVLRAISRSDLAHQLDEELSRMRGTEGLSLLLVGLGNFPYIWG